jgi:hypothetical protein
MQLMYLDHINFGVLNVPFGTDPRLTAYNSATMSELLKEAEIRRIEFKVTMVS